MNKVRTRFAPSPTGFLHIGGLRSALFCYAWAKKHDGDFILRIEDTDRTRLVEGAIKQIISSLKWAGIEPNEGIIDEQKGKIIQEGKKGSYIQSERLDLYNKFAQQLKAENKAYKCYCSPERLSQMREVQRAAKQMPKYDRHCLNLSEDEIKEHKSNNDEYVIRFLVPDGGDIQWDDVVFGKMTFTRDQVDDFVMMKADGFPTYNFANVVDDHLMEISHVIRGQEFLSSTPKHILVYEAFGWDIPEMIHVPWILGKNKQKLSKREGDVSVDDYREKGILPEALLNHLALLGWSAGDDQDIFTSQAFLDKFDLKDIQKSGAVFDIDKLEWINGQYIRQLTIDELYDLSQPYLKDIDEDPDRLKAMLALEQPRLKTLVEIPEKLQFFLIDHLEYDAKLLLWKKGDPKDLPDTLERVKNKLTDLKDWNQDAIEKALREVVEESGRGVGDIFWPVRVALTGLDKSPGPHEVAEVLGRAVAIKRINEAINLL